MDRPIKTFEDLECWKKGRELRIKISLLIKSFPNHEKYNLFSQMSRASRSVTNNIAEGYGRFHYEENAQFVRISRGSLYELLDQITIAFDEQYIDELKFNELKSKILTNVKIINGYINY